MISNSNNSPPFCLENIIESLLVTGVTIDGVNTWNWGDITYKIQKDISFVTNDSVKQAFGNLISTGRIQNTDWLRQLYLRVSRNPYDAAECIKKLIKTGIWDGNSLNKDWGAIHWKISSDLKLFPDEVITKAFTCIGSNIGSEILLRSSNCSQLPSNPLELNLNLFSRNESGNIFLQRSIESLIGNDVRKGLLGTLPLLMNYDLGGESTSYALPSLYIELPRKLSILPKNLIQQLNSYKFDIKDVSIYCALSCMPFNFNQKKRPPQDVVLNYFTHNWVHKELVNGKDVHQDVGSGIFDPQGIVPDAQWPIGFNRLNFYDQFFHSAWSGNMARFRLEPIIENNSKSECASGWFLSVDPRNCEPHKKAIIEYRIFYKYTEYGSKATNLRSVLRELRGKDFLEISRSLEQQVSPTISKLLESVVYPAVSI